MKSAFRVLLTALLVAAIPGKSLAITDVDKAQVNYYNQLKNPGIENGTADYTASGGSLTRVTGSNALLGVSSLSWDSSATSQTLKSGLYTSQPGTINGPCVASFQYKYESASNQPSVQIVDGSGNALSAVLVMNTTISPRPQKFVVPFMCPSTGQYRILWTASGNADPLILDDLYIGADNRFSAVNQMEFVGSMTSTSGTFNDISSFTGPTDVVSTLTGVTYTGAASSPGGTLLGLTLTNLKGGEYLFMTTPIGAKAGSSSCATAYELYDGTSSSPRSATLGSINESGTGGIIWNKAYLQGTTVTVRVRALASTNSANCVARALGIGGSYAIYVYRVPSTTSDQIRTDQIGWMVDANISGANPSLGTATVTSYTGIENGSLTLTNNSVMGGVAAQIPCSGTNPPTGTTCSAGNESVGIVFYQPTGGMTKVCASFAHDITNGSGGQVQGVFQLVETPINAQTILQFGKDRVQAGSGTANTNTTMGHKVCGDFTFTTPGLKAIRLMYVQSNSGTVSSSIIVADASGTIGNRDIHFVAGPSNYLSGANAIYDGLVTSNATGRGRSEYASIAMAAKCSASPCTITSQSGGWLTSVTRNNTGDYTLNIASGIFSGTPSCQVTGMLAGTTNGFCVRRATNASSIRMDVICVNSSFAAQDDSFDVHCRAPN